jgi:hypothetical protein
MNAVYKLTIVHYMNPRFDWFNPDFPSVFLTFLRLSQGVPPLFPRFAPFFSGSSPTLTPKTAPFNGPCTVPAAVHDAALVQMLQRRYEAGHVEGTRGAAGTVLQKNLRAVAINGWIMGGSWIYC